MTVDPLSDVLTLLRPQSLMCGGFNAGGDWSIRFSSHVGGIKCYSVVRGEGWLCIEGEAAPIRLQEGDCFLLTRGRPFVLTRDPALPTVDAETLLTTPLRGRVLTINGGGDCFGVGGYFRIAGDHAGLLLSVLPPVVHIRRESDKATMRWSLEQLMQELRDERPGSALVAEQLAYMILVQALRLYLAERPAGGVGWLYALADAQLGRVLGAMHTEPARRWTLAELAGIAGMSRSSFAERFKRAVGSSPLDYLLRWRMLLACDRLRRSAEPVGAMAFELGYESESAFSTAFRRVVGCSPRQYSRRVRPEMEAMAAD